MYLHTQTVLPFIHIKGLLLTNIGISIFKKTKQQQKKNLPTTPVIFNIYRFITHVTCPWERRWNQWVGLRGRYWCLCSARHLNKTLDNTIYFRGTTQGKVTLQREEWHHEQSEREEMTQAQFAKSSCSCPYYILLILGFVLRNRQRWRDCEVGKYWMRVCVNK